MEPVGREHTEQTPPGEGRKPWENPGPHSPRPDGPTQIQGVSVRKQKSPFGARDQQVMLQADQGS